MQNRPELDFIVLTPAGTPDPSLAIAGSRAGALGVLNLEFASDPGAAMAALERLAELGRSRIGILLDGEDEERLAAILARPLPRLEAVLLAGVANGRLGALVGLARREGRKVFLVATTLEDALAGQAAGVDAIIAKGNEAGGWVGEETAFVLLQRLRPRLSVPVWVHGGVGLHTAAACDVAGATGVVLDGQLLLARESPLPDAVRARLRVMDGSETVSPGAALGAIFRAYSRPDLAVSAELRQLEEAAMLADGPADLVRLAWRSTIRRRVDWGRPETSLLAVGQDAAFAAGLARRFGTVGGIIEGLRRAAREAVAAGAARAPIAEGAPLAVSHGTRYPIVQGPMTRVSDRAEFAEAVAEAGALPFLALALMRAPEATALLEETHRRLGDRPWGVGILGFVPAELRAEQFEVIRSHRPPFALIAGGRPDQSRLLEGDGITTYLHVPSPGLLRMFLQEGARHLIFEGRECGGHVGPRTSFVLWESMIDVLLEHAASGGDLSAYHVLFAGGVHDGPSAAMVAAMASPLVRRGMKIGVLLGTAYLFTEEAVRTGAIVPGFQQAALACDRTVLLESGPGHATRCVPSPFASDFKGEKRRLIGEGLPPEELRNRLEALNIGRLRLASKGVDRDPSAGDESSARRLVEVPADEQWSRGMYMIGQVAALRDAACTMAQLHREVSEGSTRWLAAAARSAVAPAPSAPPPTAIAIVGMACILPGAPELRAFWSNLLGKVDAITEVPAERWDWRAYFDPARRARDRIYSRWGGFIDDVPFDPAEFGMPPSSLTSIEPFQLLALLVVRAALKDAGYLDRPFPRERTSVILGAGGGGADLTAGYMVRSSLPSLFGGQAGAMADRLGDALPEWTEDSFPGLLMNVAAGRVANRFDLGGVNCTVDAACASSLAAAYLAVRDLEARTSDVAVVGGVDAIQNPFAFLCFSKTQALSPTGRCRTFDAEADGIAISEGFAAVILRRLEDAERDGDRIYAVIRGVGGSSDGRDRSMTAPRPEGQVRALRRAYAQAGFSPATVELIEAHGTGTAAGDQAEVRALTTFFDEAGAPRQGCAIGSVKSMVGHTKATAGVAGLIKVAMALNHRVLPPTIGVTRPNPRANFPASPFYVNSETRPWIQPDPSEPRRAGVSAFGFGGTNFHLVLEEYNDRFLADRGPVLDEWPAEVLVWRGRTRTDLLEQVSRLAELMATKARPRLADLAFTTVLDAAGVEARGPSLAIVATGLEDLVEKLRSAGEILRSRNERVHEPRGIHFAEHPMAPDGRLAFLFPGQGSQHVNMARDLAVIFDEVREVFEAADHCLTAELGEPLSRRIFPPPAFELDEERRQAAALTETRFAQPALAATGLAMLRLLREVGVEPQMVAGHSFGEFIALAAAGCLGDEDLLRIAAARGQFVAECTAEESGAMAAVAASPEELAPLVATSCLTAANLNAPRQTVLAGSQAEVERAIAWCEGHGLQARRLPVACAFHSPLVAPARDRLAERLRSVAIAPPRIPAFSNTTGGAYPEDPRAIVDLLSDHLVRPVAFVREVRAMYEAGARLFLEVGPRNILAGLVGQILEGQPHLCASLDVPGRPGLAQWLGGLAAMMVEGVPVRADRLFLGRSVHRLDLTELARGPIEPRYSPTTWLVNGGRARPAGQREASSQPVSTSKLQGIDDARPAPPPAAGVGVAGTVPRAPAPAGGDGRRSESTPPGSRASGPSSQAHALNGDGATNGGPAARALGPPPRPAEEGVTMSYLSVQSPRVPAVPPAQEAWVKHAVGPPPDPPPNESHHGPMDLARQFQQVMMQFLHTQEVVMRDILGSLGNQGLARPASPHQPRLHAVDGENGHAIPANAVLAPAPTSPLPAEHGTWDGTTIATEPSAPPPVAAPAPRRTEVEPIEQAARTAPVEEYRTPALFESNGYPAETPPRPASGPPGRQEITERLLAIVGERTGYPEEMLTLDADLEADLGIDSIKRVEIAGTLIRSLSLPESQSFDIEKLTASRSLRQVIDHLEGLIRSNGVAEPAAVGGGTRLPFDDARADIGVGRFAPRPAVAPPVGAPAGLSRAGVVLIIDDDSGVGRRLADRLGDRGYRAVRCAGASAVEAGVLTIDHLHPDVAGRLAVSVRKRYGAVSALVHLSALRSEPGGRPPGRDTDGLGFLFRMTQALRPDLERAALDGGAAVLAATAMGGSFGIEHPEYPISPEQGGLVGFLKTLSQEWPSVRVKAVDLPPGDPEAIAHWLVTELLADDGLVEVGYRDGHRTFVKLVEAPMIGAGDPRLPIDEDSVVLATGGARGITARAALALAEAARPTLLLVGRSPLNNDPEPPQTAGIDDPRALRRAILDQFRRSGQDVAPALVEEQYRRIVQGREIRENLARIRQAGSRVEYLTCDVRDADAFGALIDDLYRRYGRIDGVLHGAGTIEDRLIRDKSPESFVRVVGTKVDGARILAARLRPEMLRFLVFFGSIAGRFGNRGQADYAAANEVLNKLAQDLDRQWPARVVSINWGPWLGSGMVPSEVERQFAARGVVLIPPDLGCRMLVDELRYGRKGEAEILIGGATGPQAAGAPAGLPSDRRAGEATPGYPLLGRAGLLSRNEGIVQVDRPLSPEVDRYLRDHCLDGQPVFPFAMAMELMAEVAAAGWPDEGFAELRAIQLLRGIIVDRQAKEVQVLARRREGSRSEIDLSIADASDPRLVHYRAVLVPGRPGPMRPEGPAALGNAGPMPMSIEETYREWLFHGPLFRGISAIEAIGPGGARAVLRPSSPRDCLLGKPADDWLIDPVLIDSALQMQVIWARHHWGVTLLPARIDGYRTFGTIRTGPQGLRYELRIRAESRVPTCLADHYFYSPDGGLLAVLLGVEGTGSKALNRLAGGREATSRREASGAVPAE